MNNTLAQKMGLGPKDRAVVFHFDDLGMCQSTIPAYENLLDFGLVSSASVMVPCPWFPEVARYCKRNPGLDIGIHLTFTCEWDVYRWAPISTVDTQSGMIDDEGYLHRTEIDFQKDLDLNAFAIELEAQIQKAKKAGIEVTHLDNHMLTVFDPRTLQIYLDAGIRHQVPVMTLHPDYLNKPEPMVRQGDLIYNDQLPLLDDMVAMSYTNADDRVGQVKQVVENMAPGVTFCMLHPAVDSPELRAIAPDWQIRVADYEAFMSKELKKYLHNEGVQLINYQDIHKAWWG